MKKETIYQNAQQEACDVRGAHYKTAKINVVEPTKCFEREGDREKEHMACQNGWCLEMPFPINEETMVNHAPEC
jgi:hypothetical protein